MTILIVQRVIRATPERLFDAWTRPEELTQWWGPQGVTCVAAEMDLRVDGRYRIGNRFSDGTVLWIAGQFEIIQRPRRLAYTWHVEGSAGADERVEVRFEDSGEYTRVIVTHERIPTNDMRNLHEQGWLGCLDGLMEYLSKV